jgi:hypothetical protein
MRQTAAIMFAFVLVVSGCGESTTGDGGAGGTAGSGGSAGSGGTSGAGGDGGTSGTGGNGGAGGAGGEAGSGGVAGNGGTGGETGSGGATGTAGSGGVGGSAGSGGTGGGAGGSGGVGGIGGVGGSAGSGGAGGMGGAPGPVVVTETIACPEYDGTSPQIFWSPNYQTYYWTQGCNLPPYGNLCPYVPPQHVGTALTYTDHRVEGVVTLLTAKVCNQTALVEQYDTIGIGIPVCLDAGGGGVSATACHTWYPPLYSQPDGDGCVSIPVDGELTPHGFALARIRDQNGISREVFDFIDVACGLATWGVYLRAGDYLALSTGTVVVTYEIALAVISLRVLRLCQDMEAACGFGTAFTDEWDCGRTITAEWTDEQIATSEAAVIEAETFPVTYCPIVWTGVAPP